MALLLARLGLAAVFATALVAKARDREGARWAIAGFGVPPAVAAPLEVALLGGEAAVTVSLLFRSTMRGGSIAALALLTLYTFAIIGNVLRGRAPECHCFGRLSKGPVGWSTVARNTVLGAVAGYVATGGRLAAVFGLVAGVGSGVRIMVAVRRSRERSTGRLAPGFSVADGSAGSSTTLDTLLLRRTPVVLVFSHSDCGACVALMPLLAGWQAASQNQLTIAVLGGGSPVDGSRASAELGLDHYLFDESSAVARSYGVNATPCAVLIGRDGRIAAPMARGSGEIADLITGAVETSDAPRFERRTALGIAALATLPIIGSACGTTTAAAARPKTLHIDGAYICDQKYALCTDAPCVTSPTDPSIVICDCKIKTGYAVGFKSCSERAPKGTTLHSNFSTQLVTASTQVMTCPADAPWGNCLDVVCNVDPHDASKVQCQCVLVEAGPSLTFGGSCQTNTCTSTIWSAATSNLPGSTQLEKGMKQIGLPLTLPKSCPAS
ncbi:MAG TPA: MauE/DoxX family redox-associated membrane protein [Acidimicrobiales bacterium]|nr:MauE/DoxX family redox-associated membrane protein [Acidimicrobiales bacterium]